MNSQVVNDAIIEFQRTLGLSPESVSPGEFAAEVLILLADFHSDCLRIGYAEENTFESTFQQPDEDQPSTYHTACINVICQEEDTFDGPGKTFCFTYYDGDDTPAGSRHALIVTNLTNKSLVYWRERNQDPLSEWAYNLYARGQFDFKFSPDGSDPRFMTREKFYAELKDSDAKELLGVDSSTEFLAEVAHLNDWNGRNGDVIRRAGVKFDIEIDIENRLIMIAINCNDCPSDIDMLMIVYTLGDNIGQYALAIYEGNAEELATLYERDTDQDEATEWLQNSVADDPLITDEYGNVLFLGEPIQE